MQVGCAGTQADQPTGAGRLQEESSAEASISLGHWSQIQVQVSAHGSQGPDKLSLRTRTQGKLGMPGPRHR